MAETNDKLIVAINKIKLREDTARKMSTDTIDLSDEEKLLDSGNNSPSPKQPPTMSDIWKILQRVDANTADNNLFKAKTTKRLDAVETKSDGLEKRIESLEQKFTILNSEKTASNDDTTWFDQKKLRNNISVIGIPLSNGENLTKIIIDVCSFFGVSIQPADLDVVYRVKSNKSNMIIVKFTKFESKAKLMAAKSQKKLKLLKLHHCLLIPTVPQRKSTLTAMSRHSSVVCYIAAVWQLKRKNSRLAGLRLTGSW